ncbi:MAG: DNA translocase FtsK 4TM domain-containing protein [Candidatus Gracilibacteria bacterium]|jgi:S-DNA-T family DNA segregation ATPase FtsK/SpoIIIE
MAKRRLTRRRKGNPILNFEVESHIMREIWAVAYLALAALTWLSLNQQLGVLGDLWVSGLRPVFGVGLEAVPFVLLFMGASVFFSKQISWGLARLTGVFALAVSILGFVHMGVPETELLETAQMGQGGGYIGFVSSFIFTAAFGRVGAFVLLVASFLIGVLLTLQVSLGALLRFITPSPKMVRKVIDTATPEFTILPREEDELRIVSPASTAPAKELLSMTIKELSMQEVEERMAKALPEDDDSVPVETGEEEVVVTSKKKKKGEPELEDSVEWSPPPMDLLEVGKESFEINQSDLKRKADLIKTKLEQFGIDVSMNEVHVGPTVVQYTLRPADGVKLSKITSLKNDIALALAAPAVRIEAPIPGKSLVGIEIPSASRTTVHMREMMETAEYIKESSKLKIALGRDVSGRSMVADLAKMPHLLIAGATGSGKSVGLNSFLVSFLYNNSPKELKFIMIDPKQVELSTYNGLPHLLTPVITDPEKAATALRWAVAEMNRRYKVCAEAGHRNIADYNADRKTAEKMAKIVIVIDELADLMMQAQKEVEASICRIAQMARAVGMHLIVATQRPSVDVITGLIKANIPARIAFTVASGVDSRTILDTNGAEDLLGSGDMLYISGTMGKPVRIQGIFVSSKEIEKVTNRLKLTHEPVYQQDITSKETAQRSVQGVPDIPDEAKSDEELVNLAIECLKKNRKAASTSSMQRYLRIGYSRAARIIDLLEQAGVIGPAQGSKPRDVFVERD